MLSSRTDLAPAGVANRFNKPEGQITDHSPDRSYEEDKEKKYGYHISSGRQQEMLRSISAANLTKSNFGDRSNGFLKKSGSTD
jgi:hypothetical protein